MRLRTDNWHLAGQRRARDLGALDTSEWMPEFVVELNRVEPAQPGDCWRLSGHGWGPDGVLAGYVLTCPVLHCDQGVHPWTHAYNCPARRGQGCNRGDRRQPGVSSCWDWTGNPEDNTLTARPSLQVLPAPEGYPPTCQFHGHLTNGVLA